MEDCYITERGDQAFHCQKYRHSLRNSRSKKKKNTKKKLNLIKCLDLITGVWKYREQRNIQFHYGNTISKIQTTGNYRINNPVYSTKVKIIRTFFKKREEEELVDWKKSKRQVNQCCFPRGLVWLVPDTSLMMPTDGHAVLSSHCCWLWNNMLLFSLNYRLQTLAFVIRYTLK